MNKNKIKICHIVSADITLKFMLLSKLKALINEGYEVHAVSSPGKWIKDIEKEGIKVKQIVFKRKISMFSDLIACFKLYFYFRKEKFDVVHTHTIKPEIFGQVVAKLAGVPIILNSLHGFDFSEDANWAKKKFFIMLERIAAKCSTVIFSISRGIIKIAVKEKLAPSRKIFYLGRDIDIDRFNPNKFDQAFINKKKNSLSISCDKKIIGIVARMVAEKGFLELFEALGEIVKKKKDVILLVVGPEEPEKKDSIDPNIIKKYGIEKNVVFLGDRTDMEEIYAIMDIFVLPSHREGLGASILEASSMEKAVIATKTGGCFEAVNNGKTGLLVPVKNSKELEKSINYFLDNPEIAKEFGRNGRIKAIKEYDKNIVIKRLLEFYRIIIRARLEGDFRPLWKKRYDLAAEETYRKEEILFSSDSASKYYQLYFLEYFKNNFETLKGKKVLDVGCGIGIYANILAERNIFVTATDYSDKVVELASKTFKNRNINYLVANAYKLPFPNNSYDGIIFISIFQHFKDYLRVIEEFKRVLKPGGVFSIITLNSLSLDSFFQREKLERYSPSKFKKTFEENGFDNIKIGGVYFFQKSINFVADVIFKNRLYKFLNYFFPVFSFVCHSFYIEGVKK